jgi:hypothetical protein
VFPVPVAIPLLAGAAAAALVFAGGAAAAVDAAGGAAAALAVDPVMGDADPVPFCEIAICWNIAWVFWAVGLIENVIPFPQCPACLQ